MLKKRQVRLATLSVFLVLGTALAACSAGASPTPSNPAPTNTLMPTNTVAPTNTPSNPLVGKWEGTDEVLGVLNIEFKSDGVYEVTDASGTTFVLAYEMVDADTFTLTDPSGQSEPATVDFVRSGDTLTMTMDGGTLELHKVP